jgi:hypothetical protein
VKETEGERARLRRLEANYLTELDAVKQVEQGKVDNLNQRLGEVDAQCQKLSYDMQPSPRCYRRRPSAGLTRLARSTATWQVLLHIAFSLSSCQLLAGGWRQGFCRQPAAGLLRISPAFGWRLAASALPAGGWLTSKILLFSILSPASG